MTLVSREKLFAEFDAKPPANPASVVRCQSHLKFRLPADYVQFLEQTNGGEGFVGKNYLSAWPIEDLIQFNKEYHVDEAAPGLFLFGSSGGGEAFAFDTRAAPPADRRRSFYCPEFGRRHRDSAELQRILAAFVPVRGSLLGSYKQLRGGSNDDRRDWQRRSEERT